MRLYLQKNLQFVKSFVYILQHIFNHLFIVWKICHLVLKCFLPDYFPADARKTRKMPRNPNPRKRKRKQKQNQRELPSSSWEGTKVREPYPDHPHPTPEQCRSARDALLQLHGFPKEFASYQKQRKRKRNNSKNGHHDDFDDDDDDEDSEAVADNSSSSVLDGLISTLLSQNTTDANSTKAFQSLKSTFPSWQQVLPLFIHSFLSPLTLTLTLNLDSKLQILNPNLAIGEFN